MRSVMRIPGMIEMMRVSKKLILNDDFVFFFWIKVFPRTFIPRKLFSNDHLNFKDHYSWF